jgi:hypothetical protein
MKVAEVEGLLGLLGREEGGKGASNRRRAVLIPRESGGWPVRAPCPMRGVAVSSCGLAIQLFTKNSFTRNSFLLLLYKDRAFNICEINKYYYL